MVALLDNTGGRKETIRYSAYGTPFGMPAADANGSGSVNVSDFFVISGAFGESYGDPSYSVLADINLDGTVNASDSTVYSGQSGHTLGHGNLSRSPSLSGGAGNRLGLAGWNLDPATSKYSVRFRWYDPLRGRWMNRDPIGYSGGVNLYSQWTTIGMQCSDYLGLEEKEKACKVGCGESNGGVNGLGGIDGQDEDPSKGGPSPPTPPTLDRPGPGSNRCGPEVSRWLGRFSQSEGNAKWVLDFRNRYGDTLVSHACAFAAINAALLGTTPNPASRSILVQALVDAQKIWSEFGPSQRLDLKTQTPWELPDSFPGAGDACPTPTCIGTITLCGSCVTEDVGGNILFGYISHEMGLFLSQALAGAHAVSLAYNQGPDPPHDQMAIVYGYEMAKKWPIQHVPQR